MKPILRTILLALALLVPALTEAQLAYTTKDAHLRAGPRRDYPVVAILPYGSEVAVQGCLADYSWCDVTAGFARGWVYAGNLDYYYQNAPVPLIEYGPSIGIFVVPFLLAEYWDHFYRDRPWYRERDHWLHAPRPPRATSPARPPVGVAPAPRHEPRIARPGPGPQAPGVHAPAPRAQAPAPGSHAPAPRSQSPAPGARSPATPAPDRPRRETPRSGAGPHAQSPASGSGAVERPRP